MPRTRIALLIVAALTCGCGDEVVGAFESGTSMGPTSVATFSPTSGGSSDGGSSSEGGNSTGTGSADGSTTALDGGGFMPPGCYRDDFDNDVIDAMWNTWQEPDAELLEAAGVLKLRPPTTGVFDTGIVSAFDHVFPFSNATVRMRVVTPPDPTRPELLFLTVLNDVRSISIELSGGEVITDASEAEVSIYHEAFPVAPYPAYIGLRADGTVVHFETSDDGVTYTSITQADMLGDLVGAAALVMAQTYADNPTPTTMMVDELEVCAN